MLLKMDHMVTVESSPTCTGAALTYDTFQKGTFCNSFWAAFSQLTFNA